jgi:hypothetical protein
MKHVKMFEQFVEENVSSVTPISEKKEEKEEKEEKKEDKKDDKKGEKKEEEKEETFFFKPKDLEKSAEELCKLGEKSKIGPAAAAAQIDKYLDKHAGATPPSQKKALKAAKGLLKEIVVKNTEKGRKS